MINRKITRSNNLYSLDLDFDIYTRGQVQSHQHIDRLGVGIKNVYKTIVSTNFEVLV